jgi:hypothetical protein
MLLESLEYLMTDCPAFARKLGYLREAIAIKARYRRHCEAWGPHLARSRAVVNKAIESCAGRRTALVLGSGLLLDIPIGALSAAFERVVLVDVVHLRAARRVAARYGNVEMVADDVTGFSKDLTERIAGGWTGDPVPAPTLMRDDPTLDLVISANVAAQLPVIPAAALRRAGVEDAAVLAFCRDVVRAHLDYLRGFECPVCLITERGREIVAPDGGVLRIEDALFGVSLPDDGETWPWDLAPVGEVSRRYGIRNQVWGYAAFAGEPAAP